MKRLFLTVLFLPILMLSGCSDDPKESTPRTSLPVTYIATPKLGEVKFAEVSEMTPNPKGNIPLNLNDPQDNTVLQKVLHWLQTAPYSRLEDQHQPMPSEGPTTLILKLNNGKEAWIQPATNCITNGNSTTCKPAEGYIDFQYTDSTTRTRLKSEALDQWLLGAWKQDIVSKRG